MAVHRKRKLRRGKLTRKYTKRNVLYWQSKADLVAGEQIFREIELEERHILDGLSPELQEEMRQLAEQKRKEEETDTLERRALAQEKYLEQREQKRWKHIPQDRRCPECGELKLKRNQWSIKKIGPSRAQTVFVRCRSCAAVHAEETKPERRKRLRLEALPADRICPKCNAHKPRVSQWVVPLYEDADGSTYVRGENIMCQGCTRKCSRLSS